MARSEFSRKTRQQALERAGYRCEASEPRYGFDEGQRCNCHLSLGVQFDHETPDQLGGDTSLSNCRAVCVQCHRFKTRDDVRQIRKSDRQRDKHNGVIRPAGKIKSPNTLRTRETKDAKPLPPRRPLYEERP